MKNDRKETSGQGSGRIKALAGTLAAALILSAASGCGGKAGASQAKDAQTSAAAAGTAQSGKLTDVKFAVGNTGTGGILPVVAAEANFDEEEGLNIILEPVDNASNTLAATASGKADVGGWSSAAPLSYIAKGNDLTIYGGLMSDYESLVVTPKNKAAWGGKLSPDFLKGKKIAVNRTNSGDIALRAYFASEGVDLKTIQYIELDSGTSVIEAVRKGSADAGIVNGGFYKAAEKQGLVHVQFIKQIIGRDFICCRQLARPSALKDNRDLYVKIQKALIKAYHLYKTDQNKTVDLASHYLKLSKDDIRFLTYQYGDLVLSPDPDIQGVYNYYEGMKKCGYIDANTKVDILQHVDTSIYRDALKQIVQENPKDQIYQELQSNFKETVVKNAAA